MNGKQKIKDYESLEEAQSMKKEDNDFEPSPEPPQNKTVNIILLIALIIFIGVIAFFFLSKGKKQPLTPNIQIQQGDPNQNPQNLQQNPVPTQIQTSQQSTQPQQNPTPSQNQTPQQSQTPQQNQTPQQSINQQNQSQAVQLNNDSSQENKTHEKIEDLLPKIDKNRTTNLTQIFESKKLSLTSKNIHAEYISFLRPINEGEEKKYQRVLFANLSFENYTTHHIYNYTAMLKANNISIENFIIKIIPSKKFITPMNISKNLGNNNTINSASNIKNLGNNNTINSGSNNKNVGNNNTINSGSNNKNVGNNNTINSGSSNKNLGNNNITNTTASPINLSKKSILRNLEIDNQAILKEFYLLCDQKKIDTVQKNETDFNYNKPFISIIIPFYNKKAELIKTLRSIQAQTLKNLEIIIVDDNINSVKKLYKNLSDDDFRLRIFSQSKNLGNWRKRIDGFLYSRGIYILHINPGDLLADSYVLEDLYEIVTKYNLDTVRFSFSRNFYNYINFKSNIKFMPKRIYPNFFTKIIYGKPPYNIHVYGYGTIWNRLVRANIFTKALLLVDEHILNVYKNLWEDMWWNDLVDRVSFSNLVVNRLGYIFLNDRRTAIEPFIRTSDQRDQTIREFILFWYFDYLLLPKNNTRKFIVKTIRSFNLKTHKFYRLPMSLKFLKTKFSPFERLLKLLGEDPLVEPLDKKFVIQLYNTTKKRFKKTKNKKKNKKQKIFLF